MIMVVQSTETNVADQRILEVALWERSAFVVFNLLSVAFLWVEFGAQPSLSLTTLHINSVRHSVPVMRCTLAEIGAQAKLDSDGNMSM